MNTTTTDAGISPDLPDTAGEIPVGPCPPAPEPPTVYPQAKLRIVANYLATSGEAPESVEIEVNDTLPDDLLPFVDGLIVSLFRHSPVGGSVQVTNNAGTGAKP